MSTHTMEGRPLRASRRPSVEYESLDWSVWDRASIGIVFLCLSALNITPVLSALGSPLALAAAFVAVFNPFAAVLYIAASQIVPDPPGLPLTLAQLFVFAWVLTLLVNGCLKNPIGFIARGLRFLLPFMVLWLAIGIVNRTVMIDWIFAFISAAIICPYIQLAKGQFRRLLWMLVLGAGLGIAGHWGTSLGIPVEGKVYDQFNRGGFRMGSGRADVNTASMNVGFALWTSVALLLPTIWLGRRNGRALRAVAMFAVVVAGAVPLIAMGSRGGLGYLALGGLTVAAYTMTVRNLNGKAFGIAMLVASILLFFSPILWPMFLETAPGQMLLATLEYNEQQADSVGSNNVGAGRSEIWSRFLAIALEHPWFGVPNGTLVDMGEYGYQVIGESSAHGGTGHNVWLDIAAGRGFPTAILFAIAFVAPVYFILRRRGVLYAFPFVIAHVMIFLAFMNLSAASWKTYWVLHVITAVAAAAGPSRTHDALSPAFLSRQKP